MELPPTTSGLASLSLATVALNRLVRGTIALLTGSVVTSVNGPFR